ncbi:sugar ABC transporter permease [Devosia sp. J2-20]|jgi:putative multiple sugar transport system permease protein|uniref:Xylose transport system permease protein XylH n=1 Tax=Devosia litorisediminis TaxID=2829817 RepID=A0A942I4J2_9HYPH|nr:MULTISPECIES: multiple monosaccharide ABC transporter permease [Devosia]MBS3847401.1 sugar ABC transporter permease [Devosia litorisediminis]MCZ4347237.1 sugar ABC transporter permease [Devosia neptuniae]WDQ99470.1 sugar ABC transporter permease [Devosia sp. J2-20]|tara:strand:+ start:28757 stop:30040 length:1284 start_codon:yes stop_codon:yes gene_type:complete
MSTETAPSGATPTGEQPKIQVLSVWGALKSNMRDYGLLAALILIMLFFQYFTNGVLFKPVNLTNIILQNSYIIVMALGMLLVIVAGHIDLSVGSVSGFVGALAAMLMVGWNFPPELAFLANPFVAGAICIVVGASIGAAQGYLIAYHKIPAFIVTLAGMLIFKGLALAILGGKSVGPFPAEFQLLSAGFIPDPIGSLTLIEKAEGVQPLVLHSTTMVLAIVGIVTMIVMSILGRKRRMARGYESEPFALFVAKNVVITALVLFFSYMLASYRGLPNVLVVMAILIAVFVFVTKRMTFGRRIYALGGNLKAASLSGIKTERMTFYVFAIMGALAALAGMIYAARLNSATPKAGQGLELDVIAAVFIGGASALGGVGAVAGAVIGAFIMGVMNNGMSIMGVNIDWQQMIKGVVLLAAVFFDLYNKKRAG